jgi:hypothetical protein
MNGPPTIAYTESAFPSPIGILDGIHLICPKVAFAEFLRIISLRLAPEWPVGLIHYRAKAKFCQDYEGKYD